MRSWRFAVFLLVATMALAACGSDSSDERADEANAPATDPSITTSTAPAISTQDTAADPSDGGDIPVTESSSTSSSAPATRTYEGDGFPPELTGFVEGAIDDLATRLGVELGSISIDTVEEVVWPDGGLGCPQPDMKYAQVLVDGLRIVLVHDGLAYDYHSGGTTAPFLCAPGAIKDPGSTSDDVDGEVDGITLTEKAVPSEESVPMEQPGGPGGEPDV